MVNKAGTVTADYPVVWNPSYFDGLEDFEFSVNGIISKTKLSSTATASMRLGAYAKDEVTGKILVSTGVDVNILPVPTNAIKLIDVNYTASELVLVSMSNMVSGAILSGANSSDSPMPVTFASRFDKNVKTVLNVYVVDYDAYAYTFGSSVKRTKTDKHQNISVKYVLYL